MRFDRPRLFLSIVVCCAVLSLTAQAQNTNYVSNKKPLVSTPFTPLPLGSIEAKGWLATQLQNQKTGLTGYSEVIYSELKSDAAWLGGKAPDSDWERPTYYLRGLVALAYTLNDTELKQRAQKWIDWALNSQRADGSFGPPTNNDWWARMPMLNALTDYAEATQDKRVVPFLTKYFKYQLAQLEKQPLKEWASARAADNANTIYWLYNRTGDGFLLQLASKIKAQAYNYTDIFTDNTFITGFHGDFYPKHGVNVSQAYKYGPVFYQQTHSDRDKHAFETGVNKLGIYHSQVTGMNSCTEFLAGTSSIQGVELCSTVERMLCDEIALSILGTPRIGDELERITFNQLPAGISPNFHQHQYYTLPNQVQSKDGPNGFGQDYGNGVVPGPFSGYPCCRFNLHMGWPKYTQHCWMATSNNGLAATTYSPTVVHAKVGKGAPVTIIEDTNYPFEEQIRFTVSAASPTKFPLQLRIPGWCLKPVIKVNGQIQQGVETGEFYTIDRIWKNKDQVTLDLPMEILATAGVSHSATLTRGPLIFTLKMNEQWKLKKEHIYNGVDFSEYEVYPGTSWNYALTLEFYEPEKSMTVEKLAMPENPFAPETTPIRLKAKGRKIDAWGLAANGIHAAEPPMGFDTTARIEDITLIPFGAQRIRVTYFPINDSPVLTKKSFTDSFEEAGHTDWINFGGGWQPKDGKYFSESYNVRGAKSVVTNTDFADLTYNATITILDDNTEGGVLFRVSSPSMGVNGFQGYYAAIHTSGKLILGKSNNNWESLASFDTPIAKNKAYNLKVVARGETIQVYLDDMTTPKITVTDKSYTTGSVGLRQYCGTNSKDPSGQTVIYENVSANQLQGK